MKYISATLIVLGLAIVGGSEAHDWNPMFATQIALGTTIAISGVLFALHTDTETE